MDDYRLACESFEVKLPAQDARTGGVDRNVKSLGGLIRRGSSHARHEVRRRGRWEGRAA